MEHSAHSGAEAANRSPAAGMGRRFSFFVAPTFFGLAAWFLFGPDCAAIPAAATPALAPDSIVPGPLRQVVLKTDPPTLHLNGFDRTCMDCHRTFTNPDPRIVHLQQHWQIQLRHGINTHCYHCHDRDDRNLLTARDGEKIPFPRVDELCAQCHPGIHGDWLLGVHGKRLGYWDPKRGGQDRIVCTGCHDPHWPSRPAMAGTQPLSGPHTLRMGTPAAADANDGGAAEDPLQRAILGTERGH
ncbi:MAG: hypothetical protein U1E73_07855 [Planctomycetota bacterium]